LFAAVLLETNLPVESLVVISPPLVTVIVPPSAVLLVTAENCAELEPELPPPELLLLDDVLLSLLETAFL